MKVLLDTHIWVWLLLEPHRLPAGVSAAIADTDNELILSAVSLWEVLNVFAKGRITPQGEPTDWVRNQLNGSSIAVVDLTPEIIYSAHRLAFAHKDPADRWIVATALAAGATLLTVDRVLVAARLVPVISG